MAHGERKCGIGLRRSNLDKVVVILENLGKFVDPISVFEKCLNIKCMFESLFCSFQEHPPIDWDSTVEYFCFFVFFFFCRGRRKKEG